MLAMKLKFAIVCTLIFAILYQYEVPSDYWTTSHSTVVDDTLDQVFKFVSNPNVAEKWFQWIPHLKSADSRPLGPGKQYKIGYKVPLFGEFPLLLRVVEYTHKRYVRLESETLLKPLIEIRLSPVNDRQTRIEFKIGYNRHSLLFHLLFAPVLSYLTRQQIQHALFSLRMFFPL